MSAVCEGEPVLSVALLPSPGSPTPAASWDVRLGVFSPASGVGSLCIWDCLAFHSSKESRTSSSTASIGGKGLRQHIGGSGCRGMRETITLKGSLSDVDSEYATVANRSDSRASGSLPSITMAQRLDNGASRQPGRNIRQWWAPTALDMATSSRVCGTNVYTSCTTDVFQRYNASVSL